LELVFLIVQNLAKT